MFLLSIQPTNRPEFVGPPVSQPGTNNSTDLDLFIGPPSAIDPGPPLPPVHVNENEEAINTRMQELFRSAAGLMTPINLEDREKCFEALSKATGCEDTEKRRKAVDEFLGKICEAIASHRQGPMGGTDGYDPAKDFDQNGDGKLDAKDLIKIFSDV